MSQRQLPFLSLKAGLVKVSTSSPELHERLARLRPASSHYRPSEVSLSEQLPSIKDSNFSFQTLSPEPPDHFIATPALTVAVETLAPEEEDLDSDSPSSSGPHQEPPTPSPTVSNFFPDVAIDYTSPISRSNSQRTRGSFISRFTSGSKASVPQRVLAKLTGSSRRTSKVSEQISTSHRSESTRNSSEVQEYPSSERQFPISEHSFGDHDHTRPPSEALFSPSEPAFSPSGPYTPSEYQFTRSRLYTPSERSSVAGTPYRSSLKNPLSKLRSFRNNSSRVSFKNLSPISSGDRPLHSPGSDTREPPDDLDHLQLGSPEFVAPSQDSSELSPPARATPSKPSVSSSIHAALPGDSIHQVVNLANNNNNTTTSGPHQVVSPAELVASPTVYPTEYGSPAVTTVPASSRPQSWWYTAKVFSTTTPAVDQPTTFPEEPTVPAEPTPKPVTPVPLPPQIPPPQGESKASEAFPQNQNQSRKSTPASDTSTAKGLFGAPTPYTRTTVLPSPPLTVVSNPSPPSVTSSVRSAHRTRKPTKSSLRKRTSTSPSAVRPRESLLFPRPKEEDTRFSQFSTPSNYSSQNPANHPLPPSVFSVTAPPTVAPPEIPLPPAEHETSFGSVQADQVPLPPSSFTTTPADPACIPLPPSAANTAPPSAYPSPPSSVPTVTRGLSPKHSRFGSRASSRINSRITSRRSSRRNTVTRLPSIASSGLVDSANFETQEQVQVFSGAFPTPPVSPPTNNLQSSPSKSLLSETSPGSVTTSRRSSVFKIFSRPTSHVPPIKALKSSLGAILSPKRGNSRSASQTTLPLEESTPLGSVNELAQEPESYLEGGEETELAIREVPPLVNGSSISVQTTPKPSRKSSFTLSRLTPSRKSSKQRLSRKSSEPLLSSQQATPKPQVYREASPSPQPQVYRQASPQPQLSRQSSQPQLSRKSSYHHIFTPSLKPSAHLAPNELAPLPNEVFEHIPAEIIANMPMNDASIDGLDEEYEYGSYNWFQPKAPETISPPYIPMPGVVEQNEAFIYALQAAPNVLYGQYKQYGQLGVLGWCAEFSDLIEALKLLGVEGNMFVNTRSQALATCQELLKLKLDIKMQIIIMYLSSQVARLRRFLDGEKEYDDYPIPNFPLDVRGSYN
ncbi:hypothetical protein Clacol_004022 [Clathrus columnatus]|uniref:Uncharacterized protein n=1 Tax=Clathrus columnatus TaxID=1419009 RepID=A0AAV5A8L5_9AGAM|nr:hypothetical protein Clacol_004022 [Clathrus columnatus]